MKRRRNNINDKVVLSTVGQGYIFGEEIFLDSNHVTSPYSVRAISATVKMKVMNKNQARIKFPVISKTELLELFDKKIIHQHK